MTEGAKTNRIFIITILFCKVTTKMRIMEAHTRGHTQIEINLVK